MEFSENHSAFHYFNSFSWSNLESFTSIQSKKREKTECKAKSIQESVLSILGLYILVYDSCQNRSRTGGPMRCFITRILI